MASNYGCWLSSPLLHSQLQTATLHWRSRPDEANGATPSAENRGRLLLMSVNCRGITENEGKDRWWWRILGTLTTMVAPWDSVNLGESVASHNPGTAKMPLRMHFTSCQEYGLSCHSLVMQGLNRSQQLHRHPIQYRWGSIPHKSHLGDMVIVYSKSTKHTYGIWTSLSRVKGWSSVPQPEWNLHCTFWIQGSSGHCTDAIFSLL